MKKLLTLALCVLMTIPMLLTSVSAAAATYTVNSCDSLWKIAVKHEVGLSEIKNANPQIKNYDLIYPGQIINIPTSDAAVINYEQSVIRLINEIRTKNGFKACVWITLSDDPQFWYFLP